MKTAILSIGNELLEGYVINTNASYFSSKLNEIGIKVNQHLTILDNEEEIIKAINYLKKEYQLIIVSGGLGPTSDDITKESIAKAFDLELVINKEQHQRLKNYFIKNNIEYHPTNDKQALFSNEDTILINNSGTANGYYFSKDGIKLCVLPGPPNENKPMFDEYLKVLDNQISYTKDIYLIDIGESTSEQMMQHLYHKYPNVYIGTYMQDFGINYRISSKNEKDINNCFNELKAIFSEYYLIDSNKPLNKIVNYLIDNKLSISFAESCTAGLACSLIASIPGSSTILKESLVTYANEAKHKYLKVSNDILNNYGAVSNECAKAMATSLNELTKANICISITGIAGPDGGTKEKPVGLVYFAININNNISTYKMIFRGSRNSVRIKAAKFAIFKTYQLLTIS